MPPKARASKKRARSPEPEPEPKTTKPRKVSKRTKNASPNTAGTSQENDTVNASGKAKAKLPKATKPAGPRLPSFHGNFDIYAMKLGSLNSVFTPERDYAALLKVIRTYQAKDDNSGQIYLPENASAQGRLESSSIRDPLSEMPFEFVLKSIVHKDPISFTAGEGVNAYYSESESATAGPPGLTANFDLGQCGVSSTSGWFKMRRAWVGADGKDEVFEGFLSVKVVFDRWYRRKMSREDGDVHISIPFWAVRARVGEDGKEIGLGPRPRWY